MIVETAEDDEDPRAPAPFMVNVNAFLRPGSVEPERPAT